MISSFNFKLTSLNFVNVKPLLKNDFKTEPYSREMAGIRPLSNSFNFFPFTLTYYDGANKYNKLCLLPKYFIKGYLSSTGMGRGDLLVYKLSELKK